MVEATWVPLTCFLKLFSHISRYPFNSTGTKLSSVREKLPHRMDQGVGPLVHKRNWIYHIYRYLSSYINAPAKCIRLSTPLIRTPTYEYQHTNLSAQWAPQPLLQQSIPIKLKDQFDALLFNHLVLMVNRTENPIRTIRGIIMTIKRITPRNRVTTRSRTRMKREIICDNRTMEWRNNRSEEFDLRPPFCTFWHLYVVKTLRFHIYIL